MTRTAQFGPTMSFGVLINEKFVHGDFSFPKNPSENNELETKPIKKVE
jgi:hypothetical protein